LDLPQEMGTIQRENYINLGKACLELKQYEDAAKFTHEGIKYHEAANDLNSKLQALEILINAYNSMDRLNDESMYKMQHTMLAAQLEEQQRKSPQPEKSYSKPW